ncbi:hypothetical protein [Metallibacterium scheffleri]|nr:hypothetical protein [Metallibacterium scheffleri]
MPLLNLLRALSHVDQQVSHVGMNRLLRAGSSPSGLTPTSNER